MKLAARLAELSAWMSARPRTTVSQQVSIGVAWSSGEGVDADALVAQADKAMYASKREGAGRPELAGARPQARRAPPAPGPCSRRRSLSARRAAAGARALRRRSDGPRSRELERAATAVARRSGATAP